MNELIGQKIEHKKFGKGIITKVKYPLLHVDFNGVTRKFVIEIALENKTITGTYSTMLALRNSKKNYNQDKQDLINMHKEYSDTPQNTHKPFTKEMQPVIAEGRELTKTWWGKHWNKNLERYSDYNSRIGRGRNYIRKGAIIDLKINTGTVNALVAGSRQNHYKVTINIDPLAEENKARLFNLCKNKITSMESLISGEFPEEYEQLFMDPKYGFFPTSKEIHFDCTCPDWAYMCKHVTAVLYGIGVRLDDDPTLFFKLRNIDMEQLMEKTMADKLDSILLNADKHSDRELDPGEIKELFGI